MAQIANEINWLRSKVDANPASIFFARLADQYLSLDEIDRAIDIAERGLVNNPHYATAHYILAKCYIKRQEFDRASKYLKDAISSDPDHLAALNLYSELLNQIGSTQEAQKNYQHILKIDPIDNKIKSLAEITNSVENNSGFQIFEEQSNVDSVIDESDLDLEESQVPGWPNDELDFLSQDENDTGQDSLTESGLSDFDQDPFEEFTTDLDQDQEFLEDQVESFDTPEAEYETYTEPESESESEQEDTSAPGFDEFELSRKYEEEGAEFTKILDDIFSDSLDEEERREEKTRTTIENIAKSSDETKDESSKDRTALNENLQTNEDQDIFSEADDEFEPLMPFEEDSLSPEEQILNTAQIEDDLLQPVSEPEFPEDDEESLPDEFVSFEDQDFAANDNDFEQPKPEAISPDMFTLDQDATESENNDLESIFDQDFEPEPMVDNEAEFPMMSEEEEPLTKEKPALNDEEYQRFISSLDINEDESITPEDSEEDFDVFADHNQQEKDIFGDADAFSLKDQDDDIFSSFKDPQSEFADPQVESTESKEQTDQLDNLFDDDSIFSDLDQDDLADWDLDQDLSSQDFNDKDEDAPAPDLQETQSEPNTMNKQPSEQTKEKFVTPTLGEIYAAQGQYSKAISVFETLLKKNPDNDWYQKKLEYLRQKLNEQS